MKQIISKTVLAAALAAWIISFLSCDSTRLRLRPVQMELFKVYEPACATNSPGRFREIHFDPYLLVISESNKFSFRETDLRGIDLTTNHGNFFISFHLKKKRCRDFYRFTTVNSNAYIAVIVNGEVRNLACIREPISNGRLQFVCAASRSGEIDRFIRLFVL